MPGCTQEQAGEPCLPEVTILVAIEAVPLLMKDPPEVATVRIARPVQEEVQVLQDPVQ